MRSIHNQMLGIFRMVITTNMLQHFTTEVRIFVFALLINVNRIFVKANNPELQT
jgi:hypothetical protein